MSERVLDLSEQGLELLEAMAQGEYLTDEIDLDPDAVLALISALRQTRADLAACQAERDWLSASATVLAKKNGRLRVVAEWANKCLPHIPPAKETTELAKSLVALDGETR